MKIIIITVTFVFFFFLRRRNEKKRGGKCTSTKCKMIFIQKEITERYIIYNKNVYKKTKNETIIIPLYNDKKHKSRSADDVVACTISRSRPGRFYRLRTASYIGRRIHRVYPFSIHTRACLYILHLFRPVARLVKHNQTRVHAVSPEFEIQRGHDCY